VYAAKSPRNEIASLSKLVFQAFKENDLVTIAFVKDVVQNIYTHIQSVHNQLFKPHEKVPVVLAGGVFSDQNILPLLLKKELKNTANLTIQIPKLPPVGGSIKGGLQRQNVEINEKVIDQLKNTLDIKIH